MLKGIEKDVPFDSGTAEQLIAACEAVASLIDGQRGSRSSWQAMALTDFRGRFSEIFRQNGHTEAADASELAGRLREVAQGARRLKEEAEKEQRRRQVAREWEREQEDRNILQEAWDDVFGSEPPPVGPAAEPPTIPGRPSAVGSARHPGARRRPRRHEQAPPPPDRLTCAASRGTLGKRTTACEASPASCAGRTTTFRHAAGGAPCRPTGSSPVSTAI